MWCVRAGCGPGSREWAPGHDLHQLATGRALALAGVTVPSSLGPIAHSDGDVVCHALTDAILGAAGAGDIGQQFPDTDPRWKDAPGPRFAGASGRDRARARMACRTWTYQCCWSSRSCCRTSPPHA